MGSLLRRCLFLFVSKSIWPPPYNVILSKHTISDCQQIFFKVQRNVPRSPENYVHESNMQTVEHLISVKGYYFLKSISLFLNKSEKEKMAGVEGDGTASMRASPGRSWLGWCRPACLDCEARFAWFRGIQIQHRMGDRQPVRGFWRNLWGLLENITASFCMLTVSVKHRLQDWKSIYLLSISVLLDQILWATVLGVGGGHVWWPQTCKMKNDFLTPIHLNGWFLWQQPSVFVFLGFAGLLLWVALQALRLLFR